MIGEVDEPVLGSVPLTTGMLTAIAAVVVGPSWATPVVVGVVVLLVVGAAVVLLEVELDVVEELDVVGVDVVVVVLDVVVVDEVVVVVVVASTLASAPASTVLVEMVTSFWYTFVRLPFSSSGRKTRPVPTTFVPDSVIAYVPAADGFT